MIDFTLSPEIEDLRVRVRAFVEEHVLPLEAERENFSEHENIPLERLAPVRAKARAAGHRSRWPIRSGRRRIRRHNMVLTRSMREESRDFWSWSAGNRV